jgi:hypothetical protein
VKYLSVHVACIFTTPVVLRCHNMILAGCKSFLCSLQMEKEIKELKLQRDLAQSRLQDILQVVGDNNVSKHPVVHAFHCFLLDYHDSCCPFF